LNIRTALISIQDGSICSPQTSHHQWLLCSSITGYTGLCQWQQTNRWTIGHRNCL